MAFSFNVFSFSTFRFNIEDAIQVCVGAFALAVPIAFSEESWRLGETLPLLNIAMLFCLSLLFLGVFTYHSVFQQNIRARIPVFVFRIVVAYFLTALVVFLVLLCLDKLPFFEDPLTSIKRIIVITMPASMGAIVVDSFDKE
ncbi:DUF2391 family protein [Shewanella profunda]|uniref:DUF2391 family protein n=1 Tax=Shewanella profunda TaxID=254793 RepID=UPI00200BC053|nr:DUF2391 family protein [Shewanella profunda]MCL1090286.1 DUF2391 family protein [Shewanella profunda]